MTPIHDVLSQLRWDPRYAGAIVELAYVDRPGPDLARVAVTAADLATLDAFALDLPAPDGEPRRIPLHRVREVWVDGALHWQRPA